MKSCLHMLCDFWKMPCCQHKFKITCAHPCTGGVTSPNFVERNSTLWILVTFFCDFFSADTLPGWGWLGMYLSVHDGNVTISQKVMLTVQASKKSLNPSSRSLTEQIPKISFNSHFFFQCPLLYIALFITHLPIHVVVHACTVCLPTYNVAPI